MKKRLLPALLFILVTGGVLARCEKPYKADIDWLTYNYYVWDNESNHSITLSVDGWFNESSGFKNLLLQPGERHEEMVFFDGELSPGVGWTVTVLFDDGFYGTEFYWDETIDEDGYFVYRPFPEDYDVRYNPVAEENYLSEEVKNPEGCRQCAGVRWTYTFTDDDYNAAVAYAERTAE